MEQENAAVIAKVYAAFADGDVNTIVGNVAQDARWTNYGPNTVPYAGSYRGHSEIVRFFHAIASSTRDGKVTAETYIATGDTVVALGRYTATVTSNGARIDVPIAHIFTLRNGKITKWIGFSDSAAVAAAHTGMGAAMTA